MRLAFIFQVHCITNTLLYNISKIQADANSFAIIHFDKKAFGDHIPEMLTSDNVRLLRDCIEVNWGASSQFEATYHLFKSALLEGFDYVSFLSGDDVIVGSIEKFRSFLVRSKGSEFFGIQFDYPSDKAQARLNFRHPKFFLKKEKKIIEKIAEKMVLLMFRLGMFHLRNPVKFDQTYKGSNWFTISSQAALSVVDFVESSKLFFERIRYSYCCDEVLLPSILMASGFGKNRYFLSDDNLASLRYVDWCSGPDYPRTLQKIDYAKVVASGNFFARKLPRDVPIEVLDSYFGE